MYIEAGWSSREWCVFVCIRDELKAVPQRVGDDYAIRRVIC
jgi:hypothetical protein